MALVSFKSLLDRFLSTDNDLDQGAISLTDIQQSAFVLMVEVITADQNMDWSEELLLRQLISNQLAIGNEELEQVIQQAKQQSLESLDYYQHTKRIREDYSIEEKQQLMLQLWLLALADGVLDKHEDYALRRIADLIYIPHSEYIKAKQQAKQQQSIKT